MAEAWKETLELDGEIVNRFFQPIKQFLANYIKDINSARKAQKEFMEINPDIELIKSYEDTANKVEDLIGSYNELKNKTILTKDEQSDLKNIMIDISNLVPSAVTSWNDYGEAIVFSTSKAKEFVEQQKEMRLAEAEYQLLKLEYQEKTAKAEYETNKEKLKATNKERSDIQELLKLKQKEYEAANKIQLILADPSSETGGYVNAMKYIRENKDALSGTWFDLNQINMASDRLSHLDAGGKGVIARFEKLQKTFDELEIERAGYELGMKEFELLTVQIEQVRAELQMLTGDYGSLIEQLEAQMMVLDHSRNSWGELNKQYEAGTLSAEDYITALQSLIDASKKIWRSGSYSRLI